jgi:GNAT superfamily N-acetyltransferase
MIPDELITTYLEMADPAQFMPAFVDTDALILPVMRPDVTYYRFLYHEVGHLWRWRDRLALDDDALYAILASEDTQLDVLYADGLPAGYIELAREGRHVEIAYFGLREAFIGRGLGKHLLSHGIQQAWAWGAARVWLHTCNLDGPHALANYEARGFRVYDVKQEPMPAHFKD